MRLLLGIFIRLNLFAFCVLLSLHEAEGLPPMVSKFLNKFVYRRGRGGRRPRGHRPAAFESSFPDDNEIVFSVADSYNVPSVDYSQIDFGTTYQSPPAENTYLPPAPAPISLHHYNTPSVRHPNYQSVTSTSANTQPPTKSIIQQKPSQIISSLKSSVKNTQYSTHYPINPLLNGANYAWSKPKLRAVLPVIEIGKPAPPQYKIIDNFQQSFQVTLTSPGGRDKKKRSPQSNNGYTPQNSYAVPTNSYAVPTNSYAVPTNSYGYNVNPLRPTKQGSIVTKNKIYFSPRLLAYRSKPLQIGRTIPPEKIPINIFTELDQKIDLLHNISLLVENTKDDRPHFTANKLEDDKTYVAVHLQSYSTLRPPGNDSDLIEAQKDYGFGAHNFLFGNIDSILSVFEMLLRTDFENKGTSAGGGGAYGIPSITTGPANSLEDTVDCIRNFVNATEKLHFWSHARGEVDAANLFQRFPRDPLLDAIPFVDTAPITDTLSATVF